MFGTLFRQLWWYNTTLRHVQFDERTFAGFRLLGRHARFCLLPVCWLELASVLLCKKQAAIYAGVGAILFFLCRPLRVKKTCFLPTSLLQGRLSQPSSQALECFFFFISTSWLTLSLLTAEITREVIRRQCLSPLCVFFPDRGSWIAGNVTQRLFSGRHSALKMLASFMEGPRLGR